ALAGVMLAAALPGGAGDAHAQTSGTLASWSITDPHGNAITVPFAWPGTFWDFDAIYTVPYVIFTGTPSIAGEALEYGYFDGTLSPTTPFPAGVPTKIALGHPNEVDGTSIVILVNSDVDESTTIVMDRTLGGIPADPVVAAPTPAATSLALNWTAPADTNGADITGYKIRWATAAAPGTYLNTNAAAGMDVPGGASASAHTIDNLTTGAAYQVQVAAANSYGAGGWSDAQTATPGAPGAPRAVTAVSGNAQLDLAWNAPANDGGAAIEKYRVRWAEGAGSTIWIDAAGSEIPGGAGARTYTLTGLTNGSAYAVQIAAENSNGTGVWSASQNGAPMADVPGAPQSVMSAISDATLSVSWLAPADDGGADISDYKVRWKRKVRDSVTAWINPPGVGGESAGIGLAHTITGLINGTTYEVQVAAVNSVGNSAWSAPHRNNPATPPHAPGGLRVQPGAGLLTLTWTAPANDGGDAITEYAVRWAEGDGSSTWIAPPGASGDATGPTATNYVLRDLKGGTTYEVQVAAVNRAGTGAWTASAQGETTSFNLDVDASGTVDWKDGVMIARHLAGVRGAALVTGMGDALDADTVAAKISSGALDGGLDVDDSNTTTAADGIMIARYLLGVTSGDALTAGMSATDSVTVAGKIAALPMAP
ncbi:MAG: fibronectin type III domain-containing protein, partial [Gammaproteobacteria bacterium]